MYTCWMNEYNVPDTVLVAETQRWKDIQGPSFRDAFIQGYVCVFVFVFVVECREW